jgi:hypothetical protein
MPRNRMLRRLDDELVTAKQSLAYWCEEKTILAEGDLRDCAEKMVQLRESEIQQLIEAQEALSSM